MPTSTYKGYELQTTGSNVGTWGTTLNNSALSYIDQNVGGITTAVLSASNIPLSESDSRNAILRLTGTLLANVTITTYAQGFFFVENLTSGNFTVSVRNTSVATAATVPQGTRATLISDATNGVRIASNDGFAPGTVMLFAQTNAPTGWTKSTTHNNKALRVVSGAASSGGSVDFTSAFTSQAVSGVVGDTTLTINQIPAHTHSYTYYRGPTLGETTSSANLANTAVGGTTGSTGGGQSHTHTFTGTAINLSVSYVDVILATKD